MTRSISSSVLYTLKLNRTEPWAMVKGTPMARSTWEGWSDPEVQADPEEAQIPYSFIKAMRRQLLRRPASTARRRAACNCRRT